MNENEKHETVFDVRKFSNLLKENFLKILGWSALGIMISFVISFVFMEPKYSATIDLLVNQKTDNAATQYNAQQADLQAITTYKDVLKKDVILSPVLHKIKSRDNYSGNLNDLQNSISIQNENNSQVLSVTVKDDNAFVASDIANVIGVTFSKKIKTMMKINNVTIVSKAKPSTRPISPNKKLNLLVGFFAGLIFGTVIVVLKDLFDTSVKSETFLSEELGLVNLGKVGHMNKNAQKHEVSVLIDEISSSQNHQRV